MSEEISQEDLNEAKQVLGIIRQMMDGNNWRYEIDEEGLSLSTTFKGQDLAMDLTFLVDPQLQIVALASCLPFNFNPAKTGEIVLACNKLNTEAAIGCFSADLSDNTINFCITTFYCNCMLSTDVFEIMLGATNELIDEYNDKFLALSNGLLDIDGFYKSVDEVSQTGD